MKTENKRFILQFFCLPFSYHIEKLIFTSNDQKINQIQKHKTPIKLRSISICLTLMFAYVLSIILLKLVIIGRRRIVMISEKGVYGMVSGMITTALLQPFQNIKMALMMPPSQLAALHARSSTLENTISSCKYIYEADGLRGFYKGLAAATLKAGLGCYIYFTGLRAFEVDQMTAAQNFLASSLSRLASTFLTNPLNIIQTRFELAYFHGYDSISTAIFDILHKEGMRGFFSGGLSSCIKEGTFGGFHYTFYEEFKTLGWHKLPAGILSGMVATAFTHPFEIIRAKLQTQGLTETRPFQDHLILAELRRLKKEGGWTKGLAPRLIKKPIANTLTFLMFEIMEEFEEKY